MNKDKLLYDVPDYKKVRVIIDTDAACEADDPFAIAQALLSRKFIVKGIVAEHYNQPDSMLLSYREILTVLGAMNMRNIPVFKGEAGPAPEGAFDGTKAAEKTSDTCKDGCAACVEKGTAICSHRSAAYTMEGVSEGARFIIDEALRDGPHPLYVLCQGAITNVAAALAACPDILARMTIVWIGTHGLIEKAQFREFNAGNDIASANFVLSSGADIWLIPSTVYGTITLSLAEIQQKIYPCGKIGKHLFENMVGYNMSDRAGWTKGESWSIGDNPAPAAVLNPDCGHWQMHEAPVILDDTSSSFGHGLPLLRLYTDMDSRYVLEDLFAKLTICYG